MGQFFRVDYIGKVRVVITSSAYFDIQTVAAFPELRCHAQFLLVVETAVFILHLVPFAVEERQQDIAVVFYVFERPLFLVGAKHRMYWFFAL